MAYNKAIKDHDEAFVIEFKQMEYQVALAKDGIETRFVATLNDEQKRYFEEFKAESTGREQKMEVEEADDLESVIVADAFGEARWLFH